MNGRTWLCLSTFLTRGIEKDSLPAILSYLKEGDGVWRWSAQALHLPRLCLTASQTTGSHLGSAVEGLTSPAKLKTDSAIPSSPPPPAASHQIVPVLLLCCHVYPLLPPPLPQCRPGLWQQPSSCPSSGLSHARRPHTTARVNFLNPSVVPCCPREGPITSYTLLSRPTACPSSYVPLAPARSDPSLGAATSTMSG